MTPSFTTTICRSVSKIPGHSEKNGAYVKSVVWQGESVEEQMAIDGRLEEHDVDGDDGQVKLDVLVCKPEAAFLSV